VCGMWGTTRLTLSLVDLSTGSLIEARTGQGVSRLSKPEMEAELFSLCEDWIGEKQASRIILGGMIGSTLGWWNVPYVQCPTPLAGLAQHAVTRDVRGVPVSIVPGLTAVNFLGEKDVMRGEELEVLAWLRTSPSPAPERSVVCIPGTHTKWVEVVDNEIVRFQTSIVGELFDVLTRNGVLAQPGADSAVRHGDAFLEAVNTAAANPENLLHLLMSVRARSILSSQSNDEACDRLSGLLIGAEIASAIKLIGLEGSKDVIPVIGAFGLAERYAAAMASLGHYPMAYDASRVGMLGLLEVARDMAVA
jgi:2-dehydro-3-deoxygalactonokinase